MVGNFSPVHNNMCDQNQVTSTLDNQPQDLQQSPISPMQTNQSSQSVSQQTQSSHNQINDLPNMVDSIGGPIQPNIVDQMNPYRRSGKYCNKN